MLGIHGDFRREQLQIIFIYDLIQLFTISGL